MFNILLYEPEIPPNTGNIIRLCANTGAKLHLVKPLGFTLEDKLLRRAGLDYHEFTNIVVHDDLENCLGSLGETRIFACSTHGTQPHTAPVYQDGDSFLFGPETRGLPKTFLAQCPPEYVIRIPMRPESRSLNLSNAAAIVLYEAWRQLQFEEV